MYNDNKYCHYTSYCIMRNTPSCIIETNILLYVFLYNENICFYYTSSCIIETNILLYIVSVNKKQRTLCLQKSDNLFL